MVVALVGGCHWILPLSPLDDVGNGPLDATRDVATADGPGNTGDNGTPDQSRPDTATDGPRDLPAPDIGPPGFCNGITLYLPFDKDFLGADGEQPQVSGTPTLVPGKFNQGALLVDADLRYPAASNYSLSQGTISIWIKPQWSFPCQSSYAVFYGSVATSGTGSAGPYMACDFKYTWLGVGNIGLQDEWRAAVVNTAAAKPYWNQNDWNHLVSTWSDKGTTTLGFVLNGDPGGNSKSSASTSVPWTPKNGPLGWLRLSNSNSTYSADAAFDEVTVWNRMLSLQEIKAINGAGKPVGVLCGL